MPVNIEIFSAAEDVFAKIAFGVSIGEGFAHNVYQIAVFAANIDIAHLRAYRQSGDDYTFNDGMRIMLQDQAIFAGPEFAFISIDQYVFCLVGLFGNETS